MRQCPLQKLMASPQATHPRSMATHPPKCPGQRSEQACLNQNARFFQRASLGRRRKLNNQSCEWSRIYDAAQKVLVSAKMFCVHSVWPPQLAQNAWSSACRALKMHVLLHPFYVSSTGRQDPPISLSQGGPCFLLLWAARRPSLTLRTPVWPQASEDGLKRPGNVPPDLFFFFSGGWRLSTRGTW